MASERIRRRRPEPRGGLPVFAMLLSLVALAAGFGWLQYTGGSPLRTRRVSSLTDYMGLVTLRETPEGPAVGLAEPGAPCRVLETMVTLGTPVSRIEVEAVALEGEAAILVGAKVEAGQIPAFAKEFSRHQAARDRFEAMRARQAGLAPPEASPPIDPGVEAERLRALLHAALTSPRRTVVGWTRLVAD